MLLYQLYKKEFQHRISILLYTFLILFLIQFYYVEEVFYLIYKSATLFIPSNFCIDLVQIKILDVFYALIWSTLSFSLLGCLSVFIYQVYTFSAPFLFNFELKIVKSLFRIWIFSLFFTVLVTGFLVYPSYVYSCMEISNSIFHISKDSLLGMKVSFQIQDLVTQFLNCLYLLQFIVVGMSVLWKWYRDSFIHCLSSYRIYCHFFYLVFFSFVFPLVPSNLFIFFGYWLLAVTIHELLIFFSKF